MNKQDKSQFAALMTGIAELYQKKISNTMLNIYWRALKRFDLCDVQRAVDAHVIDPEAGQFMVKPSDVVRHIEGNAETIALLAYSKVESTVRHIGSYTSVAFDDPIIHSVIEEMGGWVRFCTIKTEAVPFQTNEFIRRYQGHLLIRRPDYPRYLPGIFDNPEKLPVLVGDKKKAKEVMKGGCVIYLPIHREERSLLTHDSESVEDANYQNTNGEQENENN